jgi:hypothetical protein
MSQAAHFLAEEDLPAGGDASPPFRTRMRARIQAMSWLERARPMPRLSMQAFCEDGGTAEVVQMAAADRHLCKSQVSVGVSAAVAHDQDSPAPNLIVIETGLPLA